MIKILLTLLIVQVAVGKNNTKCGLDAEVAKDTQECKCPKGYIGNPNEECIKIPIDICKRNPCGPHSQCIDDEKDPRVASIGPYCVCESNTFGHPPNCQARCNDDTDCKSEEFCENSSGRCEAGCRFDHSTCKSDEYCDFFSRKCTNGCRSNHENCRANEICNGDTLKCEIGCKSDEDCQLGEFCEVLNGKCSSGCRTDENCASNEFCDFQTTSCLEGCNQDENCEFDEYCNVSSKECLKGCRDNGENCRSSEYCDADSNECRSGCNTDSQCASHEYCSDNHKCEKLCTESKCGPNSICDGRNNQVYCRCKDGFIQEKGIGCRLRLANETDVEFLSHKSRYTFCSLFCAAGANCGFFDKKLHCSCSNDRESNSFLDCKPQIFVSAAPPGIFCDCCTANQKPGCETPIDANLLKTLLG